MLEIEESKGLPCDGKLRFDDNKAAGAAAVVAAHQHGTKLKPYLCKYCEWWHLSSS